MAIFSFFRTPKPQQFGYVPRYYDADKEELAARVQSADDKGLDTSPEAMKARISIGLKRKSQPVDRMYRRKHTRRSNRLTLVILVVLIVTAMYLINNYMSQIQSVVE